MPYGLSNCSEEKLQFTPFLGVPKPGCWDSLRSGIIESHNFLVLGPILVKFHIDDYIILAGIPVLCTGQPYFLFTLNRLFPSLCLALLSHATVVALCMCVTHHLPFYWFWNLLPFIFHFPTRRTIWLKVRSPLADLLSWPDQNKKLMV